MALFLNVVLLPLNREKPPRIFWHCRFIESQLRNAPRVKKCASCQKMRHMSINAPRVKKCAACPWMALNRRRCFSSALNCSVPVAPRGYLVPMLHHTMNGHFGGGGLQLFHTKSFSILPKRNLNRKLLILSDILDYYLVNYLTKLYGFFPPNVLLFFLT